MGVLLTVELCGQIAKSSVSQKGEKKSLLIKIGNPMTVVKKI